MRLYCLMENRENGGIHCYRRYWKRETAMIAVLGFLLMLVAVIGSQIHIANDNYLMERVREKRDAVTSCANGMTTATRNVFVQTLANGKTWDCELEQKAQAVIKECLLDNGGATNGTLKLSFPLTDATVLPDTVVSQYKNALGLATSNLNNQKTNTKESIGCSFAKCDARLDILCLYGTTTTNLPLP